VCSATASSYSSLRTETPALADVQPGRPENPAKVARGGVSALAAALVAMLVFAPSLTNGFAYDDEAVVLGDPRIQSLDGLPQILSNGYWADATLALYRPFTTLSFALDWSIAPASAAWFHFVNVLLHGATAALLVLLLARLTSEAAALAGGLVFAVHPVHVEAVANVVGRSEMLAAIGVLGAALAWVALPTSGRAAIVRSMAVPIAFAFGVFSKESAIVLPALLALIDIARGSLNLVRPWPWIRSNAAALTAIVLVAGAYLAARLAVLGGIAPTRVDAVFDVAAGGSARILTALQAWTVWAGLLFAPATLLSDYGPRILMPVGAVTPQVAAGGAIALTLLVSGLVAAFRGRGLAALALLWFPVSILPVSNLLFPTGVIVAERTLYLPSAALSIGVAVVATHFARVGLRPRLRTVAFALLLVAFAVRSSVRIPAWESTDTIFDALVSDRPDAFRGQWYIARQARERGQAEEAMRRYELALSLWPWRQNLVSEAAVYSGEVGGPQRTQELSRWAVSLDPTDLNAIRVLAGTALDLGDTATARTAIKDGLAIAPDDDVLRQMAAAIGIRDEG